MEVFFSLIGVDVDSNIMGVATCKESLKVINEALQDYDLVAISTLDGSFFVTVNNPYDYADIQADLNI